MDESRVSNLMEPQASAPEESQLIRRCQHGETAAFDALVLKYQQQAFAVALRLLGDYNDAKDVTQDAFVRAYRAIRTFRGEAKFSTWLLTIVTNLCRNRRRWWARRKRVIVASLDDPVDTEEGSVAHQVPDPGASLIAEAMQRELRQQVMAALEMLDEPSRLVVVLRDMQGLSYEEIAQVLRCRVGTVKSRLNRARGRLRALLDGKL